MLVRLKKRGKFPHEHLHSNGVPPASLVVGSSGGGFDSLKGRCIEVEVVGSWPCGGEALLITDGYVLGMYQDTEGLGICSHYLIDDLDAYESDSNDEQADVGDLALAECVAELAQLEEA
jgi:hypothetical protein